MPEQTIERIARAEALFIEKVISRHPDADGKPCVIGNCQAGWAVMILASLRPGLFGPLIIARDDPLTEMIAKQIIKIAQTGVHDAAQLSVMAIAELRIR
jgi:Protein of unknown function (DUF3141)